jgi:hypothetical protein
MMESMTDRRHAACISSKLTVQIAGQMVRRHSCSLDSMNESQQHGQKVTMTAGKKVRILDKTECQMENLPEGWIVTMNEIYFPARIDSSVYQTT